MQSGANLNIDSSAGPVSIFIEDRFTFKGNFQGAPGSLFIGVIGSGSTDIQGSMAATIFAPNSVIEVQSGRTFTGQLIGKKVVLHQDAHFVFKRFDGTWTPRNFKPSSSYIFCSSLAVAPTKARIPT